MIKKTLCFSNPAYLCLLNKQMLIRLPEEATKQEDISFQKKPIRSIAVEALKLARFVCLPSQISSLPISKRSMVKSVVN